MEVRLERVEVPSHCPFFDHQYSIILVVDATVFWAKSKRIRDVGGSARLLRLCAAKYIMEPDNSNNVLFSGIGTYKQYFSEPEDMGKRAFYGDKKYNSL
jgi:hypothetical protein